MKSITEKHGYIDESKWLLDEITDKVTDAIVNIPISEYDDTYSYIYKGQKKLQKDTQGLKFYSFTEDIDSDVIKTIKVIVVYIETPEIVNCKRFEGFVSGDHGFYATSISDNVGYIYINYNTSKQQKDIRTFVKNTLYHEMRHYFDDLKHLIPTQKHGNKSSIVCDHYVNVLAEEVLLYDYNEIDKVIQKRNTENDQILQELIYATDPTEIYAWYHSFVVDIKKFKHENPNCSYDDVIKFMQENGDRSSGLYFLKNYFKTLEGYKKAILASCNKDIQSYLYYFNNVFGCIKTSDEWVLKQNDMIRTKMLKGKSPYIDEFEDEDIEKIIRVYINKVFIPYVYKQLGKHFQVMYKNMDKLITDIVTS